MSEKIEFDNLISKYTGRTMRVNDHLRSAPRWQLFFKDLPMQCWGDSKKEIAKKAVKKYEKKWVILLIKGYRIRKTVSCM